MANKMLIDAAHPEETRVVVLRGSRVEEFDFEAASKKQLRGNIYLAKVTRVEPSLQAAFVDYGGNRHGFLAFSEIHPDYYQIPVSDRQALLEAEAEEEPEEERRPPRRSRRHKRDRHAPADMRRDDATVSEAAEEAPSGEDAPLATDTSLDTAPVSSPESSPGAVDAPDAHAMRPVTKPAHNTPPYDDPTGPMIARADAVREQIDETGSVAKAATVEDVASQSQPEPAAAPTDAAVNTGATEPTPVEAAPSALAEAETGASLDAPSEPAESERHSDGVHAEPEHSDDEHAEDDEDDEEEDVSEHVEQLGGDAMEELPMRSHRSRRQYKIQEVIKRRQVLLVQVVKEERGNKGAALTTYLSLAGRYSVLMPNTAKGGGISRKITDAGDRQRLKSIAQDLEVPEGMGVILRTAGASRSKPEVKRDFEYLMRMWETVRETTLSSQAPTLVYEEGSLIKRSIRDLYNKDVEEVIVAGEAGYREAKDFMRLLMPSHARNVQPWRDPQPIFAKAGAEAQLDAMFSSHVTLRSGGYIVINQTEALVAIDVNSGRSTREHNIEDTALRTNLEAADEVARQLRLRDLAGLIVVDFIDMEENRNNRAVEKRIKDALKNDRARIQVGRISHFGLLEMSRQRIRTGVLEGSTVVCEHCAGSGMVRSTSSIALHVLRLLEDALIADASHNLIVHTRAAVALYVLNQKRQHIAELEARFGVVVSFDADETLTGTTYSSIERGDAATGVPMPARAIAAYEPEPEDDDVIETDEDVSAEAEDASGPDDHDASGDGEGQRRRRRRRRRGRDRESSGISEDAPQPSDDALGLVADADAPQAAVKPAVSDAEDAEDTEDRPERGERRRRRSRRGGRRPREDNAGAPNETEAAEAQPETISDAAETSAGSHAGPDAESAPESVTPIDAPEVQTSPATEMPATELVSVASTPLAASDTASEPDTAPDSATAPKRPEPVSSEADPAQPKRSGWWQRAKATLGG